MKKFFIITVLFFIVGSLFHVNAQDLIILKDGNTIEALVLEISPTEIRYKRYNHLDGPTFVIMAANVLSIRYENGKTEIINTATQPVIAIPNTTSFYNPRFNTIGAALGYQGVSAFGFTANGTVSPANNTFFDFNLGLGFNSFTFNGRVNFNAFVPFKTGGWYAGIGIGGGYNELFGGVFAGNITTGFLFFNWLNILYTLQLGTFDDDIINNNFSVGYSYRFNSEQNTSSFNIGDGYIVRHVNGRVQQRVGNAWVNVKAGDILTNDTVVRIGNDSRLRIIDKNKKTFTFSSWTPAGGHRIIDLK